LANLDADPHFAKLPPVDQQRFRTFLAGRVRQNLFARGTALHRCGRDKEAEALLRSALAEVEQAYQKEPANPVIRRSIVGFLYMWGEFLGQTGRAEEAEKSFARSVELAEQLLKDDPDNFDFRRTTSTAYHYLARQLDVTKPAEARAAWEKCVQLREDLTRRDPKNDRWQINLMTVLPRVGKVEQAAKMADQFRAVTAIDNEMRLDIALTYARCATATQDPAARERYAASAVSVLADAVKYGFRDEVFMNEQISADPVRTRADFKAVLESIRQARETESPPLEKK
jgi:tetratricopeptide (TPR) repeat protein